MRPGMGPATRRLRGESPGALDAGGSAGHPCSVMRAILSALLICLGAGRLAAQVEAPAEVTAAAVAAVQDLGKQVVLGHHQVAIDRMYPHWKEAMVAKDGGVEKLQAKLAEIARMMREQGIELISFNPDPDSKPTAYEVWQGNEIVQEKGKPVEKTVFKKWLLIIPTVTQYRITRPGTPGAAPKMEVVTTKGFQVAISDKDKNDWTFIDGSGARVSDLRRLFITLPENMILPPIERNTSKNK